MSVRTKLLTALSATALLAAGLVAVSFCDASSPILQWAASLGIGLGLAWAFALTLSLTAELRRLGTACRETLAPHRTAATTGPADEDDLAAIDAALRHNAAHFQEFSARLTQELGRLMAQSSHLSALVGRSAERGQAASATTSSAGAMIKSLTIEAAASADRMSDLHTSMDRATATASESSTQLGMILGATEAMNSTITNIAINAEKARAVAGTAVANVNAASNRVDELGAAALEINKVTDVIVEIAEQTKLLALNATIEAARAGEAGKGFAVVANEVKELALQTNNAIAEIRNKVEAMQHSTDNTITEIGTINQTIKAVNEIVVTIAGAVEEQSIPTKDIIKQLNQGMSAINGIREAASAAAANTQETANAITKIAASSLALAETLTTSSPQDKELSTLLTAIHQQSVELQATCKGLLAQIDQTQR